jgi:hypothetical protein
MRIIAVPTLFVLLFVVLAGASQAADNLDRTGQVAAATVP